MFSVGIDISKGKSTIAVLNQEGEVIFEPFEINHDQNGFNDLLLKLNQLEKKNTKILMEATGHYHLSILNFLLQNDYFVCVENALIIKKYCDMDLRKVKNDKKDALKLANYCSEKWYKLKKFQPSDEIRSQLLFLSRQYSDYVTIQTRLKIQLTNLIDQTFPGIKEIVNAESRYLLLLDIYEKYYFPSKVLEKSKTVFVNDIEKMALKYKHKIGRNIGEEIYLKAPSISTSCANNHSLELAIKNCIVLIRNAIQVTTELIQEMDDLAKQLKEYTIISNMSGVGEKTRARLIAEIGDIRRFKNANCLIAYCGIDTPPYQSGMFNATNRHITKRGNKYLRKVGYEIMKSIKSSKPQKDNSVYLFILKKEAEGKPKKVAKIAGLNKFLRIYYARVSELYND